MLYKSQQTVAVELMTVMQSTLQHHVDDPAMTPAL